MDPPIEVERPSSIHVSGIDCLRHAYFQPGSGTGTGSLGASSSLPTLKVISLTAYPRGLHGRHLASIDEGMFTISPKSDDLWMDVCMHC